MQHDAGKEQEDEDNAFERRLHTARDPGRAADPGEEQQEGDVNAYQRPHHRSYRE
jgi:hypothetical protein